MQKVTIKLKKGEKLCDRVQIKVRKADRKAIHCKADKEKTTMIKYIDKKLQPVNVKVIK